MVGHGIVFDCPRPREEVKIGGVLQLWVVLPGVYEAAVVGSIVAAKSKSPAEVVGRVFALLADIYA